MNLDNLIYVIYPHCERKYINQIIAFEEAWEENRIRVFINEIINGMVEL